MANYKEIQGFPIQNLTTDPTPYAQALADNPYAGAWSSGGSLNTARYYVVGSGNASNAIVAGGASPTIVASVEQYDGSAWTETTDLNTARAYAAASNSSPYTDSVVFAGGPPATGKTEVWNGTSWTEVNDLNTARNLTGGFGAVSTNALCCGGKDPAPYPSSANSAVESWNGSSWTEVAEFSTGRNESPQGAGTNTAGLLYGGQYPPGLNMRANTESWDGSSWTEVNDLNTARGYSGAGGSQTSALMYAGRNASTDLVNTESWNGTSWAEVADLAQARYSGSGSSSTGADSAIYSGGGNSASPTIYSNTEEWTFSGLPPSTPAADYSDAITGQMYYNSTTGQFKAIKTGGAPIGTWASGGTMNTARQGPGGFGNTIGTTFAAGGETTAKVANVESYDGSAWTETTDLNTARMYFTAEDGSSTAGLVAGGEIEAGNALVDETELWDGSTWTETADMNTAGRIGGSTTSTTNTAVLSFGGLAPGNSAKTEYWNGTSWTELNDLNTARYGLSGAGVYPSALGFGGYTTTNLANTESWDGTSWTEVSDLNTARRGGGSGGASTSALFYGGDPSHAQTEAWDGSSWTEVADLAPSQQWGSANSSQSNTSCIIAGGQASGGPAKTGQTQEWSADDFEIKTMTTS